MTQTASPVSSHSAPEPGRSPQKAPRLVFEDSSAPTGCSLYAFPPNRHTLGGTAYLIVDAATTSESPCSMLIDCPAWTDETAAFIAQHGTLQQLVITHRGAIAQVKEIQDQTGCEVIIQEQEAYLLPNLAVTPFREQMQVSPFTQVIWTPGHSPGSACVYDSRWGGVLFTGRHLLPNAQGRLEPLRLSKTFHWPRQLRSVAQLRDRFSVETLSYACPGASTGFLRGKRAIANAYAELAALDLDSYRQQQPLL